MVIFEYENNTIVKKKLSEDQKSTILENIVNKWSEWSKKIEGLRKNRDSVISNTKPKLCQVENGKSKDDWKSKIELNRPYQYYSKLYGMLYETLYDKISSYLKLGKDVSDKVYQEAFNVENKKTLLVSAKDLLDSGEMVCSAELKTIYEKKIHSIEELQMVDEQTGQPLIDPNTIISVKETTFVTREEVGKEINLIRINPINFAYDPLITPCTKEFDECDKVVKMWKTKHEILSNKTYDISAAEMEQMIAESETPNMKESDQENVDTTTRGNQIEVLTYYGSFIIDGKQYDDYVAVVVGRNKLVYFKPRNIFTPGIYYYPYHAIGNGARGTSPLFYILDLCALEQKTLNDSVDFLELQKNPPAYTPIGFFEEETTRIRPGLHITYKPGMQDPTAIIPLNFTAQPLATFEAVTSQLTEEIAGIDNGKLSVKSESLGQDEVRRIAVNENLIPNMIISGIMLNIISRYLKDFIEIQLQQEFNENMVKTAWEYQNDQVQMQNIIGALNQIAQADPTMIKLRASAEKTFETMGVDPNEYLNDGRSQEILQNLGGLSDGVLQQIFQMAQQLQVQENNMQKSSTMMGQIQDSQFKSQVKDAWENGMPMPAEVTVPNGQGTMNVPVAPVTPDSQTKNKPGVSV